MRTIQTPKSTGTRYAPTSPLAGSGLSMAKANRTYIGGLAAYWAERLSSAQRLAWDGLGWGYTNGFEGYMAVNKLTQGAAFQAPDINTWDGTPPFPHVPTLVHLTFSYFEYNFDPSASLTSGAQLFFAWRGPVNWPRGDWSISYNPPIPRFNAAGPWWQMGSIPIQNSAVGVNSWTDVGVVHNLAWFNPARIAGPLALRHQFLGYLFPYDQAANTIADNWFRFTGPVFDSGLRP